MWEGGLIPTMASSRAGVQGANTKSVNLAAGVSRSSALPRVHRGEGCRGQATRGEQPSGSEEAGRGTRTRVKERGQGYRGSPRSSRGTDAARITAFIKFSLGAGTYLTRRGNGGHAQGWSKTGGYITTRENLVINILSSLVMVKRRRCCRQVCCCCVNTDSGHQLPMSFSTNS